MHSRSRGTEADSSVRCVSARVSCCKRKRYGCVARALNHVPIVARGCGRRKTSSTAFNRRVLASHTRLYRLVARDRRRHTPRNCRWRADFGSRRITRRPSSSQQRYGLPVQRVRSTRRRWTDSRKLARACLALRTGFRAVLNSSMRRCCAAIRSSVLAINLSNSTRKSSS